MPATITPASKPVDKPPAEAAVTLSAPLVAVGAVVGVPLHADAAELENEFAGQEAQTDWPATENVFATQAMDEVDALAALL